MACTIEPARGAHPRRWLPGGHWHRAFAAGLAIGGAGMGAAGAAHAARIADVSPQGVVAVVRQVVVRFDSAVVAAGDPRLPAPVDLSCNGAALPGMQGRWTTGRQWVVDLPQPLTAGQQCTVQVRAAFMPLGGGALEGQQRFVFSTGAPAVVAVVPYAGATIDEDQAFLLHLNGVVDPASVSRSAWCEVEGLGERIPVRIIDGAERAAVLKARRSDVAPALRLLLACQRAFPAEAKVRLVWGAGIAPADNHTLRSTREQRFTWTVRPRFTAEFQCERENATAPCLPLRPMKLRFSAPVPRALALAARLVPVQAAPAAQAGPGAARVPSTDGNAAALIDAVRFTAPLPEDTRFTLTVPESLRDDAGRELANRASFPLQVATGPMPPLAKFAGSGFGILEAAVDGDEPTLLPLTLRQVQADLAGAATGGQVRIKRLDATTSDRELLRWLGRLRADAAEAFKTREQPMLADVSGVQRAELPQLKGANPRATEVIGVPLPQRGLHVVEIESRILGDALLASRKPMFARTGALVTNLGVHFKRGRSSSLVWVTSLSRGRPVAGAAVVVNDCRGQPVWSGSTGADGTARIDRGFADELEQGEGPRRCLNDEGLFITARSNSDLAFVFSDWKRGIEPWRFNLPTTSAGDLTPSRQAHTVFDRTLLRAGETVSMKHFLRVETERGLALPPVDALPDSVVLTHIGSGAETRLPLTWPRGARSTEGRWKIPATARLGAYDVALERQGGKDTETRRITSGSFRVEAFRVPLVDARLAVPPGVQVAPAALSFSAQLNALAGGPMAAAPVTLTALLQTRSLSFAGYDDFDFNLDRRRSADEPDADDAKPKLVADKLGAVTDRQGAATLSIDQLPPLPGPAELIAELGFNDPNGERQTVAQRLQLWPAALAVGLRVPGWAASKGDVALTAVVLNTEGQPVRGRVVSVKARLHQNLSVRKRLVGGFYAYDNHASVRDLGPVCKGSSDAQGRLSCNVHLDAVGEVELLASVVDDAGRSAEAGSSIWISGNSAWWFDQDNDDRIDVLPEQRELEPGQTARLQVRMPFSQATALVTVEREGIIDSRVVRLSGKQPVIELKVPAASDANAAAWAPNVMVGVLVLRGRLREAPWWSVFTWGWRSPREWWQAFRYENADYRAPSAVVDLSKPSFKFGVAQLSIGRAAQRLDVAVRTDRSDYQVRQVVHTTVRVTHDGRALAGTQIAFVAVDEGLLALQPNTSWKLLEGLLQPRPWAVETSTAQGEIIGRRHYGRKALPPGGGGGHNPTRELFDTLLLWRGTVVLDANGEAKIDVPLNDSLTRFRLVAVADAVGADQRELFGTGSTTVRVSQDLQMLPGLPLLARSGDRFDAPFTLRNTTARPMTVRATLVGKAGPSTIEGAAQELTLAAGAAQEVHWTVVVPDGVDRVEWQAAVDETGGTANAVHDRVKRVMPVVPAVPVRVWQATLMPLDTATPATVPLTAPAGALPGAGAGVGGVAATLMPRLAGNLPGVRRYFETYPYSCLEQKTSRSIGLRDAVAWAGVREEAAGYLDSDGLAAYFPIERGAEPRGSDRLTAYLIATADAAGWTWPDATRDAMLGGLTAFVEGRIERRFWSPRPDLAVRKLAALEALSRHGRVLPRMLGSVEWTPAVWPTSALLDAWSLYRRVPQLPDRAARIDEVQRLIQSRQVAGGTTLTFSTEIADDWWWLMESADANATRLLLAAVDVPEWKDRVPQLVTGALARQRRGAWQTTTANLWGVLALERFAKVFEAVPVVGQTTLQLGSARRQQDWTAQPDGSMQWLPWPAEPAPLTATHNGAGRPWLTLQALAAVPLTAPLSAGYRVTRTVTAVNLGPSASAPGSTAGSSWHRGDAMRVRLEIDAATDMAWVVLSDPVPAGATLLGSGLGRDSAIATQGQTQRGSGWLAYVERGADTWRAYYEWLPRGHHVVEYTVRLNASGRFGLPPTRVEAMYAPETFGEAPNAVLVVQP